MQPSWDVSWRRLPPGRICSVCLEVPTGRSRAWSVIVAGSWASEIPTPDAVPFVCANRSVLRPCPVVLSGLHGIQWYRAQKQTQPCPTLRRHGFKAQLFRQFYLLLKCNMQRGKFTHVECTTERIFILLQPGPRSRKSAYWQP